MTRQKQSKWLFLPTESPKQEASGAEQDEATGCDYATACSSRQRKSNSNGLFHHSIARIKLQRKQSRQKSKSIGNLYYSMFYDRRRESFWKSFRLFLCSDAAFLSLRHVSQILLAVEFGVKCTLNHSNEYKSVPKFWSISKWQLK